MLVQGYGELIPRYVILERGGRTPARGMWSKRVGRGGRPMADHFPNGDAMVDRHALPLQQKCKKAPAGGLGPGRTEIPGVLLGPNTKLLCGVFLGPKTPGGSRTPEDFSRGHPSVPSRSSPVQTTLARCTGWGEAEEQAYLPPPLYKRYGFIIMFGNYNLMLRLYQITVLFKGRGRGYN